MHRANAELKVPFSFEHFRLEQLGRVLVICSKIFSVFSGAISTISCLSQKKRVLTKLFLLCGFSQTSQVVHQSDEHPGQNELRTRPGHQGQVPSKSEPEEDLTHHCCVPEGFHTSPNKKCSTAALLLLCLFFFFL